MYAGHLAAGLALASCAPRVRVWPIVLGAGWLDMVDGVLTIAGVNRVTANLSAGPYLFFDLTFIDWDHSLVMAVVLSLVWGAVFWRDRTTAALAAVASFSHVLLDWPMHNADLALYPYAEMHFGMGLWGRWGTLSWVAEGLFVAVLLALAGRNFAARRVAFVWPPIVVLVAFVNLSPWLSPMQFVATLPEPAASLVCGAMITLGFLLPGLLLVWLIDRAERDAAARSLA